MSLGRLFLRYWAAEEKALASSVGNILPLRAIRRSFRLDFSSYLVGILNDALEMADMRRVKVPPTLEFFIPVKSNFSTIKEKCEKLQFYSI